MRTANPLPLTIALLCILILPASAIAQDENDPLEGLNRATHRFNETLDKYLLRPVALGWTIITPQALPAILAQL